ncbi:MULTISPECIES: hypothetical protein [Atopobium]|uniref:hypothetical protein n=1 Tax=Atopobium TaxID=1380 RepID=UPI00280C1173|nr:MULTISPECIES: hypothetical protein [Atopobium]MDY4522736.1 hypothetical protein [Atopobium sp.]
MAESAYTAVPITVGLPSDKSIEDLAQVWKATEQEVAEKLLPENEYKKWIERHPEHNK